jgi:hypothetical protein
VPVNGRAVRRGSSGSAVVRSVGERAHSAPLSADEDISHMPINRRWLAGLTALTGALACSAPAAQADTMYSTTNMGAGFASIDTTTGAGTVINPSGQSDMYAAALSANGTLYTTTNGYSTAGHVATVDRTTGTVTPLPSTMGAGIIALAVGPDDTLYGLGYSDRKLYRIDKTSGATTLVGQTTISIGMDMAFDCHGTLWATVNGNLYTIDPATGATTTKPAITGIIEGNTSVMGLAFDASCRMIVSTYSAMANNRLYVVNGVGAATLIGLTGLHMPHGAAILGHWDTVAPVTADDVPAGYRNGPVTVTLSATDDDTGVAHTYYETGADPAAPTTSSTVYDPAYKPVLADGERIRYFSVDGAGNTETAHVSAAAKVDTVAPATVDDVPAGVVAAPVAVTLTATDAGAGVAAVRFEVGADPAAPTASSPVYDAAAKPLLADGQKIRYAAVDAVGNAEADHASAAVKVAAAPVAPAPTGTPAAPAAPVTVAKVSNRVITLHVDKRFRGRAVRGVRAWVNGEKVAVERTRDGHQVVADLRGRACTPVTVKLTVAFKDGERLKLEREFATCRPSNTR